MRPSSVAAIAMACITAPSFAGTNFMFTADIHGATADYGILDAGHGTRTVLDLYVTNTSDDPLRLLSLFGVTVSLSDGDFVHDDADTANGGDGDWSATFSQLGGNTSIDSFVTFGPMRVQTPFAAQLDPNFDGSIAGTVSADAGWFNPNPSNENGNVGSYDRVFVGRFVVNNSTLRDDTTFSIQSKFSYNFQSQGVYFDSDSQVFTLPSVVPGPLAMVAFAGIGLAGRGRRR